MTNSLPRTLLAEMTREQIRAIAPTTTVVLPTSAIEQHGLHLPILTDTLACTTVCQRAAELAGSRTPVTVAPPIHYGGSAHHLPHPGVLTLSHATFLQVVKEICTSLAVSGFRRIVIVNGHGGNEETIRVAAREIALTHTVTIAAASYWTIAGSALYEEGHVSEIGWLPGHAGAFETSLVLALRPDLVDQASYPPLRDVTPRASELYLRPMVLRAGIREGTTVGYTDNPANGSAEHGQRFLDIITREVARFLVDLAAEDVR